MVLVTGISSLILLHQLRGLFGFDKIGSWGSEQGSPVLSLLLTVIRAFTLPECVKPCPLQVSLASKIGIPGAKLVRSVALPFLPVHTVNSVRTTGKKPP